MYVCVRERKRGKKWQIGWEQRERERNGDNKNCLTEIQRSEIICVKQPNPGIYRHGLLLLLISFITNTINIVILMKLRNVSIYYKRTLFPRMVINKQK